MPAPAIDRRQLLELGWKATAFTLAGLTLAPRRAAATLQRMELEAGSEILTLIDGREIPGWRLSSDSAPGPGNLGSGLVVLEGDELELNLDNELDRVIRLELTGWSDPSPDIPPTSSGVLSCAAPPAGTWSYRVAVEPSPGAQLDFELGVAMGLFGPLVVLPASGESTLWPGGPAFDRQYTLVLSDLDERLNLAVASGGDGVPDLENYEPNYYFLNGLSHPAAASDPDTRVAAAVGDTVLLRLVNPGLLARSMHFHGFHVQVVARDRAPETILVDKDTVPVLPGECVDVLLPVTQPGLYPLHDHYVPATTANGVYVNPVGGALTLIEAE